MDSIIKYFEGEKLQCAIGILLGLTSIMLSIYFIYINKPVLKGIGYVFIPLSLLLLAVCIGVFMRTPKDIKRVSSYYESDPIKMQTEELPRMEKVMKTFPVIQMVEIVFIFVAAFLLVVFWKNNIIKGVGIGLIIQGIILYGFDHFAQSRGKIYLEFLNSL
ncbi:MAG: hypothetical protein IPM47_05450 [Sphingobacteriales bacterium]|nr:MAG: hypothetical protein IPM47_05450 [Sphingobacteriales bacterium]